MKRIALFIAIAIAAIACKPEEQIVPEVTVHTDEATLVIPTEGGDVQIAFDANVEWTAALKEATAADWCTITPSSGAAGSTSLKVIALENTTNDNRVVTVVITAQTAKKEVKVTQLQKDALVLSGEKAFEVAADGGQVKFAVNHNIAVEAKADADWLVQAATRAMQTSEFTFDVAANTGAARTAKITVTAGDLKEELTVNQAAWAPVFEVAPAEDQWIAVEGGSVSITVDANVEYTVTTDENDWLTVTNEGGVYTFTAAANEGFDYRSTGVYVTPKDEAYVESAKAFYVFQNGRAALAWTQIPTTFDGYVAGAPTRLAQYGDYLLLANNNQVFVLNPADGTVVTKYALPEGFVCYSLCVDNGGNIIIANSPWYSWSGPEFCETLYAYVIRSFESEPELLINYSTANIWGATTGNLRVEGNIDDKAVITAVAGGAAYWVAWEAVDGKVESDANGWSVFQCGPTPYAFSDSFYACALPQGNTLADGLWFTGYGGDYSLQFCADPTANTWASVASTNNNGNWNNSAIDLATYGGRDYAVVLSGAHFNYADPYFILYDVTDKTAAQAIYSLDLGTYAQRNEDWSLVNWTGAGAHSDVLAVSTDSDVKLYFADGNFNMIGCITIK